MEVFNLDIIPGKAMPVIHCSQFDKGRAYRANLFERGAVYILNGAETLSIIEKKSDGNMVTISVTNTSDSFIEFEITEQMSAIAGPQLCELRIEEGGNVIGSTNFALDCEASPDTGIESDSAIHNLEEQIAEAVADQYDADSVIFDSAPTAGHGVGFAVTSEGVKDAIDTAIGGLTIPEELDDLSDVTITSPTNGEILVYNNGVFENQANPASTANFAADYDDTATYNTNDKVIYNGLYYIALEDSITGAWDSTKWALTTVSALTAEELPLSGNDRTPTATAIGPLSSLTTTNQDSLVDAVNEVNDPTEWNEMEYNTEYEAGYITVGGVKKTVYHQILRSEPRNTTAWGGMITNLPFTAANVIKATFTAVSSSNNLYSSYYVGANDMFRCAIETTNVLAQFGTSYPTLPARVIVDVYYTKS